MKKHSFLYWIIIATCILAIPALALGWSVRPKDLAGGNNLTGGSNVAISSDGLYFQDGTAGGADAETIQGVPIAAPAIGDVGKYIEVGSGATAFIYGTPAGGGDMTITVWDGDANGFIDLDAGGTNSSLADPGADRLMFWDESGNVVNWMTLGTGLSITTTVLSLDADLVALSGVTSAANAIPYFTGSAAAGVISSSANMVSLLGSADYATARTNLGLAIGTNVQAYDQELAALAGLTSAANKLPYFTGSGTAAVTDFTAVARNIVASGTTTALLTNLGLTIGTNTQAWDADLDALAAGTWAGTNTIVTVGTIATGVWSGTTLVKGKIAADLDADNLSAILTFANGDLIDLSAITHTGATDEGLVLPTWANVSPTSDKKFLAADGNSLKLYNGGWVTIGATAAPTDAQYLVLAGDATLTQDRKFTVGTALAAAETAGSGVTDYTLSFDPTGLTGNRTWAAGGAATIAWTWNVSTGTDPVITFGNNYTNISTGALQVSGATVYYLGGTDIAVADGGTAKSSWTQYALIYPDTTTSFSQIGVGSSGQLLQSGGGAAPGWTTATYPVTSGTSGYFLRSNGTNFLVQAPNSFTLDDIAEGSTYQRVLNTDVSASGHVNRWQVADTGGYATIAGPTGAIVITTDDTAAQTMAARNTANTFTEANTFGNADTDTLTIRSLIVGGNSRAVWIASTAPTPTYATGTTEFYVEGDVEVAGTTYSSGGFVSTGVGGDSYLMMNNNTTYTPSSGYQIYFEGGILKVYDGTEKTILETASAPTLTGATWSFASVTNMVLPNVTVDAAGEVGINQTTHTFNFHAGGSSADNAVQTLDFDSCANGQILKTDGSGAWTCQDDATGGSPTWNSIGNPTAALTITSESGETSAFLYTGAFTSAQGTQFLIEQKTGNPTGGVLFESKGADGDITVAKFGDGTNAISIATTGAMTLAGTASITAGGIILGDSTADSAGEIGYSSNIWSISSALENMALTATTNLWTFSSDSAATFAFTPAVTITGALTLTSGVTGALLPAVTDGGALGSGTLMWSDLFLASGGVINFNNGDVLATHSANTLAFSGASTGYTFDSGVTVTANTTTTGNALDVLSSSISSGNLVSIAATGTAAASNTKTGLKVATSGANATTTQTTYGAQISNTSTGTAATNVGLAVTASGGSTNNALEATGNVTITSGTFGLTGNKSVPAWTTSGVRFKNVAATITDTTSTGTVAAGYTNVYGGLTIAATNATVFTDYVNTTFSAPITGTNVTMTRPHSVAILDATSAASSITGGLVVAATLGTAATSVGIGGGNINAGGSITAAGAITGLTINGHTLTTGSSTFTGTAGQTYTFPTVTKTLAANDGSNWTFASQAAGDIAYASGTTTYSRLAKGTAYQILQMNSGATAPEWTSTLSLAALNLSAATSAIPWVVGTSAAQTADGSAYWNSTTDALSIGDGATRVTLDMTAGVTYTYPTASVTLAANDGTGWALASQAVGDLLVASGTTTYTRLASGTTAYVLTAQGAGVAPIWKAQAGGGDFMANGSVAMTAAIVPNAVNTIALGSNAAEWADLFLGDGAIIYGQNDSSATLTSSASTWTASNLAVTGTLVVTGHTTGTAKTYSVASGVTNATQLSDVTGVSTLIAAEVSGTLIDVDASGVTRFTLPTPASGYNTVFSIGVSGVTVQVESGTTMYVNGTATATGGVGAQLVSATPGQYISCWTANFPNARGTGLGEIEWTCRKQ